MATVLPRRQSLTKSHVSGRPVPIAIAATQYAEAADPSERITPDKPYAAQTAEENKMHVQSIAKVHAALFYR